MKILKRALTFILSLQLTFACVLSYGLPSFSATTPSSAVELTAGDQRNVEKIQSAIDSANPDVFPVEPADAFHLTNQKLVMMKTGENTYNLSRPDLSIPVTTVADFEGEVEITTGKDGSLVLNYSKRGKLAARHEISSIKPAAMARDKELLVILDQSGELFSIDLGYARLEAFNGPLPVVSIGQSALSASEIASAKASYTSRGQQAMKRSMNPAHVFPLDLKTAQGSEILTAGDLVLYTETADGERTQVGQFDRDVIRTQLYTAEATLAMFAFVVSPPDDAAKVSESVVKMISQPDVSQQLARVSDLSDAERDAFSSLTIQRLLQRAGTNASRGARDRFTRDEAVDNTARFLEVAKTISGTKKADFALRKAGDGHELTAEQVREITSRNQKASMNEGMDPRPLWYRLLSSKRVRVLAAVAGGSAALAGIATETAWGIHLLNVVYEHYWFDVLKDAAYRVTLLKSTLSLSSFVPLSFLVGFAASRKSGFPPIKALASVTVKIYAELILPFWHRLPRLIRQPNLMRALAQGISAFETVKADSAIGQKLNLRQDIHPALINPLASRESREAQEKLGADVLNELSVQKARTHSLARLVALEVASREAGLDPVTLAAMANENVDKDRRERFEMLAKKPEFLKNWSQLATELRFEFTRIARNDDLEVASKIDLKELSMYFEIARAKAKEIKARDRKGEILAALKTRWNKLGPTVRKDFATFAVEDYRFLREAVPSDAVVSLFWTQFTTDYLLSVGEVALIGPRADLSNQSALAANENSFLWTTPGHRFDMIDQVRLYMLSVPASFMLTFQDPAQVRETNYDPIETTSMAGLTQKQEFRAAVKTWLKDTFDPKRADEYGQRSIRTFVRRFRTMQFNISMSMVARVIAAGQAIGPALASYTYFFLWAPWGYGLIWDPINIGNMRYETKFEEERGQLIGARSKIAQGLRLSDFELMKEGYSELSDLYIKADRVTPEMPDLEKLGSALSDTSPEDFEALRSDSLPYLNAVTELRRAIEDGNPRRMATTRAILAKIYEARGLNENSAALAQLDSFHFLEYSLKHPPFATHQNAIVPWVTTMVAALSTTYLATKMGVFTFSEHVNWTAELTKVGVLSTGLYASYYFVTKKIAEFARGRAEQKEESRSAPTPEHLKAVQKLTCQTLFSGT